jgi:hypothetical protein
MPIRRKTRILLWTALAVVVVGAIGFVALTVALINVPAPVERWLQGRIQLALREHYQADVQLQNLHVTLIPGFYATADNFVLPNRSAPGLPPLITVKHVMVRAALPELLRTPVHLSWVKLDGLVIQVPSKRDHPPRAPAQQRGRQTHLADFVIDKVDADGTELYILHKDPARQPMQFELRKLTLRGAGVGQPMNFTAELTNPTPPGLIETTGRFGPWVFDEPSATKVGGHYNFQHADLSVFNGISGILSSVGDYQGILHNIIVDGTTDVPDFKLDRGGEPVHLTTQFHATVDGTNGNTYLQPVKAHFLSSDVVTNGEVAGKPGQKGKTINLDVDMQHARVQDVLTLAAKSDPPMLTGRLRLKANFDLPPGPDRVLQRMRLAGKFNVSDARFASGRVGEAIAALSRRGQGKPGDTSIADVPADFNGDFAMGEENLSFSKLEFAVPGAVARVKGSYGLQSNKIDFVGDVRLNATVSQTMKGAMHWVLVPFDPIFMKHGAGTYLPVAVTGTREHPEITVQWKKLF